MELCAVELGCNLLSKIREVVELEQIPIFLWTDSEIVLHWLRKPVNTLKLFVHNRVHRILDVVQRKDVRHIKSEENPADLISRGIKAQTLLESNLWWYGPVMLKSDQMHWPEWTYKSITEKTAKQIQIECKEVSVKFDKEFLTTSMADQRSIDLIDKYSSHKAICRITGYVFRFIQLCYEQRLRYKMGLVKIQTTEKSL